MRGVAQRLKAALGGLLRDRTSQGDEHEEHDEHDELRRDELPSVARGAVDSDTWISNHPRPPKQRPRIVANIRAKPAISVGDVTRPAALGTMLEGAMSFAIDDAIDGRTELIEIHLRRDGSATVTHVGPGYDPQRAARGLQRWPWLRRSQEGEVILTQSLAAPVVTCALSHWCQLEVRRTDGVWRQAFYRGEPERALAREPARPELRTQTSVSFRPDPLIFAALSFDIDDLYMRGLGLLMELQTIELHIHDERTGVPPLIMTGTGHAI